MLATKKKNTKNICVFQMFKKDREMNYADTFCLYCVFVYLPNKTFLLTFLCYWRVFQEVRRGHQLIMNSHVDPCTNNLVGTQTESIMLSR